MSSLYIEQFTTLWYDSAISIIEGVEIISASAAIRQRLSDLGMTQVQLAEALGTNRQNLGNKLRRDNFTARELEQISKVLGLKLAMVAGDPGKYVIEYDAAEE